MTQSDFNPKFLTRDEVLLLHRLAIEEFGGAPGLRDVDLLDSALAQPQAGIAERRLYEYPFGMAAAYGYFIARNHPFV